MTAREIWRSSAVRMAAVFAVLLALVVTFVFVAIYFEIRSELYERLRIRTQSLHDTFHTVARSTGTDGLVQVISDRAEAPGIDGAIYLLAHHDGRYLAGNIGSYPTFSGWAFIEPDELEAEERFEFDERFLSRWSRLPDGAMLLVGLSDDSVEEAREALVGGIVFGIVATILITAALAAWLAVKSQRRISSIGATLEDYARGRLDKRVALAGADDDLDQVAARINTMLDRMENLVESLRQVSADIAHELKTPIGRLRQRLDVALTEASSISEFREANVQAIEQINQIVGTFEALLRIAQIESGTRRARFSCVSLNTVLSNIVDIYGPVAADAGHEVLDDLTEASCEIAGDQELLTQMFANLLENAIHHCPTGSKIDVRLAREHDTAVVSICDDGPGIPVGERDKVVRRLYRLEKSRSTPGTGLGLSLVLAVADLHGALLVLGDNEPGLIVTLRFGLTP